MTAFDHVVPDPAITQIDAAARALKMAALEADVAYPAERIAMLRSLVQLLQNARDLADVVARDAAAGMAGKGHLERDHHRHLDGMAHHLRRARASLILSCVPIVKDEGSADRDGRCW